MGVNEQHVFISVTSIVDRTCSASVPRRCKFALQARRQICQPLRRSIDERGLDRPIEPRQHKHADRYEQHSELHFRAVAYREHLLASLQKKLAGEHTECQQREHRSNTERKHRQGNLWEISALRC
jgi:hypothetical protein